MTSRRATRGLPFFAAAACIGLGYALYLELTTPPARPALGVAVAPGDNAAPDRSAKKPPEANIPITRFEETLARPLFHESRRPSAPETGDKPAAPTALPIRLIGVVISPERRTALIREKDTPGITEIAVGQTLRGWVLERILPDRIVLKSGTKRETYRLETEPEKASPRSRTPRRNLRRTNQRRRSAPINPRL